MQNLIAVNNQPPEKRDFSADGSLEVHSIFYTIQGEGPFCGRPAVFVRLAGCNLQCPGCDTEYTDVRVRMTPSEIVGRIRDAWRGQGLNSYPIVVISGGEPFRQDITMLVIEAELAGHNVQIETNGTMPIPPGLSQLATVVCSPKTGSIHPSIESRADAFKYVLHADDFSADDGLPNHALGHPAKPRLARPKLLKHSKRPIYLQPMDCKDERQNWRNMSACVEQCMRFGYTLQLQIHKIIDVD